MAQGTDNPHEFYDYLRANTNIGPGRKVDPVTIDFVRPLVAAATTKPNVFLFVIDSLRRDYLSPYNAAVTFTPSVQRFAAEKSECLATRSLDRWHRSVGALDLVGVDVDSQAIRDPVWTDERVAEAAQG